MMSIKIPGIKEITSAKNGLTSFLDQNKNSLTPTSYNKSPTCKSITILRSLLGVWWIVVTGAKATKQLKLSAKDGLIVSYPRY